MKDWTISLKKERLLPDQLVDYRKNLINLESDQNLQFLN